ncbi:MAG: peptidase domain-containing ABC transporter [Bacteroidia bacterium]|nr:peptidase domain-containing ABC transporter [Bacteroidia bacterium]
MFSYYRQNESSDCGPACIKMIVKFHGKNISLQTLRELCHIDREGVSISAIKNAGEKIGFNSIAIKTTLKKHDPSDPVPSLEELTLPLIAFWNNDHFVVIYKISKGKVYIADPSTGLLVMKLEDIETLFNTAGNFGKVILFEPQDFFYSKGNHFFENQLISNQLKFITNHLFSSKKEFILILLILLVKLAIQVASPYLAQQTFDSGLLQKDLNVLVVVLSVQILMFTMGSGISYFEGIISNKISQKINFSITSDFIRKLFKIPLHFFQHKKTSDFVHRIYDLSKIESFLTYNFSSMLLSALSAVVLSALMIYYNLQVYLICIAFSTLYAVWTIYSLLKKREVNSEKFDIQVSTHNYITEMIEGIHEIKLNGNESKKVDLLLNNQNKFFKNNLKNIKLSQRLSIGGGFLNNLGLGTINFYTAYLAVNNSITIGEMAAIQLIAVQLNSTISSIYGTIALTQEVKFSLERILEIQAIKDELPGTRSVTDVRSIKFKNISFSYTEVSNQVIQNISFTIERNKTTAIVGTSGSGKTTLMKLALGLFTAKSGQIMLEDKPIGDYDIKEWRQKCGVVMQDGYLFTDTIVNNVTETNDDINLENYIQALKNAALYDFVMSLPIGHNTIIGKGGLALSSGQRQRILIARMFYKNPDYIFMDEATNSLDSETERIISDNLDKLFSKKTRLIIAHRLNTVRNADTIIVLKNGTIVEEGSHFELIEKNGFYYELVKEQLQLA